MTFQSNTTAWYVVRGDDIIFVFDKLIEIHTVWARGAQQYKFWS